MSRADWQAAEIIADEKLGPVAALADHVAAQLAATDPIARIIFWRDLRRLAQKRLLDINRNTKHKSIPIAKEPPLG